MKHQTDRNRPRSGRHALTLCRAVWTHPHELRHTAASLAVAAGANVKAVQQMLGHASAAMTLDVYAGLFADDLDGVADRLSSLHEIECGPNGDRKAPKPVQPGRAALRESPEQAAG
jgi:integrase